MKISCRSWLLNKNGNKGFEFKFLDDNIFIHQYVISVSMIT